MTKSGILTIVVAGLVLLQHSVALASDSSNASKTKSSWHWTSLPKQTLGVIAGIVVGIPACAVRKAVDEEKHGIASLNGNNHKARLVIPAAVFWAPFAGMSGVLEAPFYAVNNSLVNYDKPFSKEQFSLVESENKVTAN